jgi:hypothetical protein
MEALNLVSQIVRFKATQKLALNPHLKFLWGAADFVTKQSEIVNNSMQLGPS